MATPVLTKEQQRKSLSARKGPAKGLRNVLALPYEKFWPVLKQDEEDSLEKTLKKSLPLLKRAPVKVPWKELRKMTKEERFQARKNIETNKNVPDENIANNVVVGINAVTRSLEKGSLCSVLLDATIDPPLLVKHVIAMSVEKGIPVILTPFLKKVTLEIMGYATAAIGFKIAVAESSSNYFHQVYETISRLRKNVPIPKSASQLFQIEDSKKEPRSENLNVEKEQVPFVLPKHVYKYRNSVQERAFVPPVCRQSSTKNVDGSDAFIPLSECREFDENLMLNKKKRYVDDSNKDLYVPLKVKRLQGSANRTKATKSKKNTK